MIDRIKDGGPAFPNPALADEGWPGFEGCDGMTMRQWYAGQALAGMGMWTPPGDYVDSQGLSLQPYDPRYQRTLQKLRAEWALAQADAMLAAEEGKQ